MRARDPKKITSPLRYPGGKSKALNKIHPFMTLDFSEYREPFVGGGSVFIYLKQIRPEAKFKINDLNYDLFCFWDTLKKNVDEMLIEISKIRNSYGNGRILYEELACALKDRDEFHRAVRFYVLNRITYSGTVDSGGYSDESFKKRFTVSNMEKLRPISALLQDVEITNQSYEEMLAKEGKRVFVFLDPPYLKTKRKALYGINGDLNKSFDHVEFANNVKQCKHKWLITYDDSEAIRSLFDFAEDVHLHPWELQYGMNNAGNNKPARGKELLISNFIPHRYQDSNDNQTFNFQDVFTMSKH
ncbi:MAG: DNA adenine methylase [Candidatus Bathyarchaeia archaeon]|jgi:DNA adenine methylase